MTAAVPEARLLPLPPTAGTWLGGDAPAALHAVGPESLLQLPLTALFCSSRVPADLVLPALDLAHRLPKTGAVVGGFQSPLERELLGVLLERRAPVVLLHAREIAGMRLPRAWRSAVEAGHLLVASAPDQRARRITRELAARRNRLAAALAAEVVLLHAQPGGRLHGLAQELSARGVPLRTLPHPANDALLLLGAEPAG